MSSTIQENRRPPSKEEMDAVFTLCRNNHWTSCLQCLQRNPQIGESIMIMVRSCLFMCVCVLPEVLRPTTFIFVSHIRVCVLFLHSQDNHIATTVIHQAITSKGDVRQRANVILQVLAKTPRAATIKNGYGSLPMHVICQRNTKIDSKTKERLLLAMIRGKLPRASSCSFALLLRHSSNRLSLSLSLSPKQLTRKPCGYKGVYLVEPHSI